MLRRRDASWTISAWHQPASASGAFAERVVVSPTCRVYPSAAIRVLESRGQAMDRQIVDAIRALPSRTRTGADGMATVYAARDVRHNRLVAIKVLRSDIRPVSGADRFLREIRVAAQLTHPHILPLIDSGGSNGVLFYVMPYIDGKTLRERLACAGELSIPDPLHSAPGAGRTRVRPRARRGPP
jgi:Protein kinase domain